jgi:hypothetical protein
VEAIIGNKRFPLERLRNNDYLSIIKMREVDIENNQIIIKAAIDDKEALFYQIPERFYLNYLAQKKENKNKEKLVETKTVNASAFPMKNMPSKWQEFIKENGLLLIVTVIFIITIVNVWILEKEEERLLQASGIKLAA